MKRLATRDLVLYGLFIALIFLLGLTPIGFITLPIAAITTVHIPVIIGSYRFGIKGGMLLGFFFGLTSLIRCFTTPDATAAIILGFNTGFGFYNLFLILAVIFLPRVLTGLFSALVYRGIGRFDRTKVVAMGAAALTGSLTNTVFFLGGLYVFAFEQMGAGFGFSAPFAPADLLAVILGIVALNGLLEALAAILIGTAAGKALLHFVPAGNEIQPH